MKLTLLYKNNIILAVILLFCFTSPAFSQLIGIKNIPGDYTSIVNAVGAVNTAGVGTGGVTFNIAAGYTETISGTISLLVTGTAGNPIVFQKDPAGSGANPLITAYTGGIGTPSTATQDGIWRLVGSDYVTIDGIDVRDNPANTSNPSTMEYGYALYKASTSNGCQNVTIQHCVITLSNVNNASGTGPMVDGSTGIIVMNALFNAAATTLTPVAGGVNSGNKFYKNTIQNCNTGVALTGYAAPSPFTLADFNNDVGGSDTSTGNTIVNFGGASGAVITAVAIRTQAQYGLNVSRNTINNNNGSGTNHPVTLKGILISAATSATSTITYNTITLNGGGTTQALTGIENTSGSTPAANTVTISNNAIVNSTYNTATTGGFYGINNNAATPASLIINNNTISNNSSAATGTGFFYGIYNTGAATTVTINGNTFNGNSTAALTTNTYIGIYNTSSCPTLTINGNTLAGNSTSSVSGVYNAIANSGSVTSTIAINGNNIGTASSPAMNYTVANSGAQVFINNSKGTAATALSVSNNNFYSVLYSVTGSGSNTYITNSSATLSQDINNNTFTNLNVNTTGSITFISNSVIVSSTGIQNVNSNAIAGTFTKAAAAGTVTLFTSSASSLSGSVINNNNNNFSNITVSGNTSIAGWVNTDAGSSGKTIRNNTFSNWTGGTGTITALSVNVKGAGNATTGNAINTISSAGTITGIATAAGNDNIFLNTINTLSTTGAFSVTGISVTSGTVKNVYRNRIYDLQANNAAGTVYGILVSGTTSAVVTANIYNNLIGDLRTPITSSSDAIRGISITSTRASSSINVYYNTIYLNASSTAVNFGTTGVYHTVSATATTAALSLRNNLIVNVSVPNGTGFTVAYRRSGTSLPNYATTSNNNLFYAGTPAANRLLYYDGTSADQILTSYKTRMATRDAQSVTEDLITNAKFLSTTGSSAFFLHLDPAKATLAESGAVNITGYTDDYDGQTRQGNSGYTGTGTAPDIGADEIEGIQSLALSGTIQVGAGQVYTSLTNAGGLFADLNSLGLSSNLIIKITSDLTEDGTNILNQWVEQGAGNYTLTVQPDASLARLVAGNITTGMIRFNGVMRVIIDGSNGTTNSFLTFRNTSTAGTTGSAFTFINGASNNVIRYCNVEAYTNATSGVILFSTSSVTGGNSGNTISNCKINATVSGNTGFLCIYSAGTATAGYVNTGNIISNNNIFNYRDRAIDITSSGSSAWVISGNSFYNGDVSGSIGYAAGYTLHTIRILGGGGYAVLNNFIGGNAPLAAGTAALYASSAGALTYQGILLTTTSATPVSSIKGNTVANMSIAAVPTSTSSSGTNVFIGIETNGSGINIGGSLAGEGNMIGSNTMNGSILITTTTAAANKSNLRGINCNSSGGFITGNQVGGIDIKNIGTSAGPSIFYCIYATSTTAPSQITNNIIGSAGTGAISNSIRVLSTSTSTTTAITGIQIGSAITSVVLVSGNTIQNISYQNTTASGNVTGISNSTTATAVITISGNLINGNTVNASTGVFYGILSNGAPASLTVSSNTISGNVSAAGTGGVFYGIYALGATLAVSINTNIFSGNSMTSSGNPTFIGINTTTTPASLSINSNSFSGNVTASAAGQFYCITNSGAATGTININSNIIGTSTSPAITFNAANSSTQVLISNSNGTSAAALSMSNNTFQNINYAAAGTGANTYIQNSGATFSQAINSNTFTNMNVNTSGSITFISDNVIVPASGSQDVNNNSISGTFSKRVGGSVTLFTSSSASASGSIINNNNNNFSNITVPTTTVIAGWINTDGGNSTKTIQGNTFSNWTGGTGAITALTVNLTGVNNSTTGNVITNISSAGQITGITTGAGNDNIFSNSINTLSSSGNLAVTGIAVTAGTTKNIYKNKIYALKDSNATGTVNGIQVTGGTTVNIYNNLIGDLRAPIANTTTEVIRGISINSSVVSSSINVYYNTIYLNASSSGTNFSTTGIYDLSSSTATTATLTSRNNSITNTSTPKGSGLTVCLRMSSQLINNYANASNNNLVYAGTPGSSRLLYYDGTNSVSAISTFRSLGAPRESASVSEDLTAKFLSTSGSSSVFLHMNAAIANAVESGAANITGFTEDYDGQIRAGNTGYTGTSTFPDIGADEIFGIENIPPVITYTLLDNTVSTANRSVTGVTITDVSNINTSAGTKPRIYYKRLTDANGWLDNAPSTNGWKYTEATNSASPFTFTINYALLYGGAAVTAGIIQYFIVAQDLATIANVAINSGSFTATPASVALTSAAFPISGTINSYNIPFSGTFNIGTAEVFTSLTRADGLFASVNSVGLMGASRFNITSDLSEDGSTELNQWAESGTGNYTLTIQPDGASLRTVSGNVLAGLIRLNGANRVTINGSNGSGATYLNFRNTNIAGTTGTAFTFLNGAANNTIKYCFAEAFANAVNGVILFSTAATAGGNSNNLIDNCTIDATVGSNTSNVAICSAGTVGNENSSNTISNNSIYDYRDRGLDISATGSTAWTISGNSLYNGSVAGPVNYAAASALHGIRVLGGSGYSILNNYIGGNDDHASGTNAVYSSSSGNVSFQGILLNTGSALPESNIRGNTIAAISVSSVPTAAGSTAFTGIETTGVGINIGGNNPADGNTIGAVTGNGSIVITTSTTSAANTTIITGINCLSSGGVVNNNDVSGIDITNSGTAPASSAFLGINVNNSASPAQVNYNLIGSVTTSGSIRVLAASSSTTFSITGIQTGLAVNNAIQVSGNLISNISNLSTTASGSFKGINNAATLSSAMITVSSDTIQYISTAANANTGSGMYAGIVSSSASAINNNLINNITVSSSGINAQITGIAVSGAYGTTVSGNIISNLSTLSRKTIAAVETGTPAGAAILGILNSTSAAGQVISNNRLSGFSATTAAAVNVVVAGIGITSTGSGNIYSNRFGTFTNLATGAAPALCHLMAAGGSFNVYNNTSRISNLTNINGMKIYGIIHSSANNWNYFHNTIRVGGSSNVAALHSAAFLLSVNSPVVLKNNIFFNIRTGSGTHYAVSNLSSPPTIWTPASSDYNDFYSINPNTVGEWGSGTSVSFAQWKNLSGGDAHSINNAISFILSTYDLEPDSITNCNFNNAGTPITTPVVINTDINNYPRSTVNPDLGAYEFNYIGFTIMAGSNAPVCSGESLDLTVDPGDALIPHYTWRNPANTIISTIQNPSVALTAGQFKVTVTDSTGCSVTDSTLVTINPRPTARLTTQTSLCDGGTVILNIAVTGTGVISGTLSNGDDFSGTAPLIRDTIVVTGTTSFSISNLSDDNCTSIAADIPDTVTVTVTHKGDWLGFTSNWNNPLNWCEGIVPTSTVDVNIPFGTAIMPVVTDSAFCNNLTINTGDTLTVNGTGTLHLSGMLVNYGTYTDNGTTDFNGVLAQQTFSGVNKFHNLSLNNTNGLLLTTNCVISNTLSISKGILNANNFNLSVAGNWINNAAANAFAAGNGTVTFNGTTPQAVSGTYATTFNHVTIFTSATAVSLQVNANIAGNLMLSAGTLDLGIFTANRTTAGGSLTVANNTTLKIGGTGTFPVNYSAINLPLASTVEYAGTNQTVSNQAYGNLTLSSATGSVVKTLPATPLTVAGNFTSAVGAGTAVSYTAAAAVTLGGNVSIGAGTTFTGGSFTHTISGNWTNNGTFAGNTGTVIFKGAGSVVNGAGIQNFNNLTIAASGLTFSSPSVTLSGNLATTGPGSFTQAAGGTLLMTGTGKTITGTGIALSNLTVSGGVSTGISIILTGNLTVSGSFTATNGSIVMQGAGKTVSGTGAISFAVFDAAGSITASTGFTIAAALVVDGSFTQTAGTATFTGTSSLSGPANLYNVVINGTSLQLAAGSIMGIAGTLTIASGTLDATSSGPNTVNFNGPGAQNINGITYSNLILSNGGTKTAAASITTNYDLTIMAGAAFNLSSFTLSDYGNWNNNGTFVAGTSTVQFAGPATAFITGATTFNILTSNTPNASTQLFLQSNVSAAIVNMTNGIISTGNDTLTITNTRTGNGIIQGNIRRTHTFTTGVAYAFESPANTITFAAVSGVSTITVHVEEGQVADFPFGGSISRLYAIQVPAGTYNATLRLHYENDELNGNTESSMALWHYNGSTWAGIGKTGNDTTSNYVEQSGLTNITNRWTISDDANLVQWNGSVSSDWNTAANWTVIQGSGSRPPSPADIVDLGTAAFVNQPTITSTVTVKNITFGSVQPVILTLGSGGSLTTSGDINGKWTGNATHTINVNNQTLAVNGNIDLSDSTTGHAINLNIAGGTVTILGSITQSGGANILFSGGGTLHVYQDFTHTNGNFTAATGTVIYNGSANQAVANLNYYHLTINKSGGLAAINDSVSIAGNLLIAAGELDNYSVTSIAGDVTISAGATFYNRRIVHVQGNWNNNGSYTSAQANIFFDGTGQQNISASTFNNLNINKPSGTATLTGNVVITGDINLLSGTFDVQTFDCSRNLPGGITTHANGATYMIGANNPPRNFTNHILDPASITIFYGTTTQIIDFPGITFGHLILRGTGPKIVTTNMTVLGDLTIDSLATIDFTSSTVTLLGNLVNHGSLIASASTVLLNGTAKSVTGNNTFNILTVAGTYTILNDQICKDAFTITVTGSVTGDAARTFTLQGDFNVYGIWNINGAVVFTGTTQQTINSVNATIFVANLYFNGSVPPVFNSTSSPRFNNLFVNNTGGINPLVGWTIFNNLTIGSGASFIGRTSTIHNIQGSVTNNGTITSSGTMNFIPSSTATVNLGTGFSSTGTVVFGGAGAMTLAGTPVSFYDMVISNTNSTGITPSSDWHITDDLSVNSGSTLNCSTYTYSIGDDIQSSGTMNRGSSTFILNGTGLQEIANLTPFYNLSISKASGIVSLSSDVNVKNNLNFVSGQIQTGVYRLIQPSAGTVTGAGANTGWVNGLFQKNITSGAPAKVFEVGDTVKYTPVSVSFTGVISPGDLVVSSVGGDHPNIGSSPVNASRSVNRFWRLTNSGIVFTDYSATLHYVPSDIDAGANSASFGVALYNGSSWTKPPAVSPTDTSIQATGIKSFGDFAVGEICYPGTTINYPDSLYCTNAGTAPVTRTGSGGGIYSSSTGLSVDAATGAINLLSCTPGSYVITYTIAASGGCAAYVTAATITIVAAPSASISYPESPYCSNGGTVPVTSTGASGGAYSSTPGLSVNAATGDIDLATSTAGTYTVTYTIAAAHGCSIYQVTTPVTITAMPSAVISYTGSPYCSSSGVSAVARTGTPGGIYASSPGLSLDAATGSVNAGASTEGTYTVTYTVAAANGCAEFVTSASVTISTAPSATISYSGNPFCNVPGTVAVSLIGTGGGKYKSTAGLIIDVNSGTINTGTSKAGTYTITYTIAAAQGCGQFITTTNITINISGTWSGAVSNDWNTPENWQCNAVPVSTTNVNIPAGLSVYPTAIIGTSTINNLLIDAGASLTVTGGTFQIGGTITNNGSFDASAGTIVLNGTTAQTLPAQTFTGNTIRNFRANNAAGVTLAGTLNLTGTLIIINGTLFTGGYLTLKSSVSANARVAAITSPAAVPVSGNVTVERYVPGQRRYRLLTSPVTSSSSSTLVAGQENMSIWGNWQNSGNTAVAGNGTFITGGSSAGGYDQQTTYASLYTYDAARRAYIGFTTANGKNTKYTPLIAGIPYYTFIYGDRTNTIYTSTPNPTIINSTGTLVTGNQVYTPLSAIPLSADSGMFTLLGNPFASSINWALLPRAGLDNTYWGWDPNLSSTGGYVTVNTSGAITLQAPFSGTTGLNQYIQSGQGFFVRTSGTSPQLTIREQDKVANFNGNAFGTPLDANTLPLLAVNLQYMSGGSQVLADGVLVAFDSSFTNGPGPEDAVKLANSADNIAVLNRNVLLSIDARKMPQLADTVFLNLSRLGKPQYTLQIFANQLENTGMQVYLEDRYLNTTQPLLLTDTNAIVFNIDAAVPASFDANRFRIVFHSSVVSLPVTYTSIQAFQKDKDIQVAWNVAEENGIKKYEIEKSAGGTGYYTAGEVMARGNNRSESYQWLDVNPVTGNNLYRIRALQADGRSFLSKTVVVNMGSSKWEISVSPNPIVNKQINIRSDYMEKGRYTVQVHNTLGQQITYLEIDHPGGKLNQVVYIRKMMPSGMYYLEIGNGKEQYRQPVFIE